MNNTNKYFILIATIAPISLFTDAHKNKTSVYPIPTGSYQKECKNIFMDNDGTLHATCYREHKVKGGTIIKEVHGSLKNAHLCKGENVDIKNIDGHLCCSLVIQHSGNHGSEVIIKPEEASTAYKNYKATEEKSAQQKNIKKSSLSSFINAIKNNDLEFLKNQPINPSIYNNFDISDIEPSQEVDKFNALLSRYNHAVGSAYQDISLYDIAHYFNRPAIAQYLKEKGCKDNSNMELFIEAYESGKKAIDPYNGGEEVFADAINTMRDNLSEASKIVLLTILYRSLEQKKDIPSWLQRINQTIKRAERSGGKLVNYDLQTNLLHNLKSDSAMSPQLIGLVQQLIKHF